METPSKKTESDHPFSPVVLAESPVKQTPQKGNLTGNARVMRDLVADLYNGIQAWNQHHLDGYKILKDIADLKVPALKASQRSDDVDVYPDGLRNLSDDLNAVFSKLSATANGMNLAVQQMDAVISLEKLHGRSSTPLFITWPADKFGEVSRKLYSGYEQELEVKEHVTSEVSHSKTEQELMLHLAAWVYQPFISNMDEVSLQAMLTETGHR